MGDVAQLLSTGSGVLLTSFVAMGQGIFLPVNIQSAQILSLYSP